MQCGFIIFDFINSNIDWCRALSEPSECCQSSQNPVAAHGVLSDLIESTKNTQSFVRAHGVLSELVYHLLKFTAIMTCADKVTHTWSLDAQTVPHKCTSQNHASTSTNDLAHWIECMSHASTFKQEEASKHTSLVPKPHINNIFNNDQKQCTVSATLQQRGETTTSQSSMHEWRR